MGLLSSLSFLSTTVPFQTLRFCCPTLSAWTHSQEKLGLRPGRVSLITFVLSAFPSLPLLSLLQRAGSASAAAAAAVGTARNRSGSFISKLDEKKKIALPKLGIKP